MSKPSSGKARAVLLSQALLTQPAHDERPGAYRHAVEAVSLRAPLSAGTRFQLSCIGLGAALIFFHLGKMGGAMAPLHPASLVMLPGMAIFAAVSGYLAWRSRR